MNRLDAPGVLLHDPSVPRDSGHARHLHFQVYARPGRWAERRSAP